mgnify:FL=1
MTHKYVFLRNPESVNPDSVVFFVRIGDSETERRNLRVINSYAAVMGAWFERVSLSVDSRLIELEREAFGSIQDVFIRFRTCSISSVDFVRLLKHQELPSFEASYMMPKQSSVLRAMLSTDFFVKWFSNPQKRQCKSLPRKNLSHALGDDFSKALVGFGLILAFGLLSAVLEVVEKSLLY